MGKEIRERVKEDRVENVRKRSPRKKYDFGNGRSPRPLDNLKKGDESVRVSPPISGAK